MRPLSGSTVNAARIANRGPRAYIRPIRDFACLAVSLKKALLRNTPNPDTGSRKWLRGSQRDSASLSGDHHGDRYS
jgi:hypothetical protein